MSIAEGATSAISMFQAMQRNRMARDELAYQRQQDALARSDRLAGMRLDEAYRRDVLAGQEADRDFRQREYDEAAPARKATQEGLELDNDAKRIANEISGINLNSANNDIILDRYQTLEIVDRNDPGKLNRERIAEGFRTGNKPIMDAVLLQISSQLNIPKGSRAIGIDRFPGGPGFVIRIQNEDGSIGVLTEDGTSNPDSRVQEFTPESLAKFAEWGYQTGVVPNSSLNMGEFRGMQGVIEAGFRNEADVVTALPPRAQRAAVGVILSAETEEERAQVTDAIAQDAGLTPRAQVLLEQRRQAQERGKLGGNQERTTARIAEIDAELADLGFNRSGTRTEAAQIVASTENLTGPQINEAVESGALTVTPELQSEAADMMRKAGVEELQQLKRLKAKELALAKAVLMASTKDSTLRNSIATQIDNIIETGSPSMSQKDVIDDSRADAKFQFELEKYITAQREKGQARVEAVVDAAADIRNSTSDLFFPDGKEEISVKAAEQWTRKFFPQLQADLRKIEMVQDRDGNMVPKNPEEYAALRDTINQGASLVLAAYADEFEWLRLSLNPSDIFNFAGWVPKWAGGRGEADEAATTTDYIGNRIELTMKNGRPDTFYFLDANGERTDRGVSATQIEQLDRNLYQWMVQSGSKTRNRMLSGGVGGS